MLTWTMCVWYLGPEKKKRLGESCCRADFSMIFKHVFFWGGYDFKNSVDFAGFASHMSGPFFLVGGKTHSQMDPRMIDGWLISVNQSTSQQKQKMPKYFLRRTDVFTDSSLVVPSFFV